jgi:predicted NAD-dependent protein-ADP-ribosyltransferase YbiA (DUF1768 family)
VIQQYDNDVDSAGMATATAKPCCVECSLEMGSVDERLALYCAHCKGPTHFKHLQKSVNQNIVEKLRLLPQFLFLCKTCYHEAAAHEAGVLAADLNELCLSQPDSQSASRPSRSSRRTSCASLVLRHDDEDEDEDDEVDYATPKADASSKSKRARAASASPNELLALRRKLGTLSRQNQLLEQRLEVSRASEHSLRGERATALDEAQAARLALDELRASTPEAAETTAQVAGDAAAATALDTADKKAAAEQVETDARLAAAVQAEQAAGLPTALFTCDASRVVDFHGASNPFSMFFPFPFKYRPDNFIGNDTTLDVPSGEHVYGYGKAFAHNEKEILDKLVLERVVPTASAAKQLHKHIKTGEEWKAASSEFMLSINKCKYEQCEPFRRALHESGNRLLAHSLPKISRDPSKEKWGTGLDGRGTRAIADGKFPGGNELGKLLMQIREEKRADLVKEFGLAPTPPLAPQRQQQDRLVAPIRQRPGPMHQRGGRTATSDRQLPAQRAPGRLATSDDQPLCYICGESGHIMRFCTHRAEFGCWRCGKPGHKAVRCPNRPANPAPVEHRQQQREHQQHRPQAQPLFQRQQREQYLRQMHQHMENQERVQRARQAEATTPPPQPRPPLLADEDEEVVPRWAQQLCTDVRSINTRVNKLETRNPNVPMYSAVARDHARSNHH